MVDVHASESADQEKISTDKAEAEEADGEAADNAVVDNVTSLTRNADKAVDLPTSETPAVESTLVSIEAACSTLASASP